MQFKNPEILYALFLLLIPVIIHLFRLRRFQKVAFTNVAFLKAVTIQTRKSSQIKKLLTLLLRLLALATLIFAFAHPFFENNQLSVDEVDTVVYLDNSFSLQAKGSKGNLLETATQDLYGQSLGNRNITWFTNDNEYRNVGSDDFKSHILRTSFSSTTLTPSEVWLHAEKLFQLEKGKQKQLIYISDFATPEDFPNIPENVQVDVVKLNPQKIANIAVDSAYVVSKTGDRVTLRVELSKQGAGSDDVAVSVYNSDQLINKANISFANKTEAKTEFVLDASSDIIGKISISDSEIAFDNDLYFSFNKSSAIKVLTINGESDSGFLRKLFDDEKFEYTESAINNLNFSEIPDQHFIVLNELRELSPALIAALNSFVQTGGSLLLIPAGNADIASYNIFLTNQGLGSFSGLQSRDKKITRIVFSNPLYNDVFEKEVSNFQYPSVNSHFPITANAASALMFEDNTPFLIERNAVYVFTASINSKNSNFINSPLVVPTLYNMGLRSLPLPEIYYTVGTQNEIAIPVSLSANEILKMRKDDDEFIPLQQVKASHVLITTDEEPSQAGTYDVILNNQQIKNLSYNIDRSEGKLHYSDPSSWQGVTIHKDIPTLFSDVYENDSAGGLWKWFVIFALIFLIAEMFVLKFMK